VVNTILPELNGVSRDVAASSGADRFVRGVNGHLMWRNSEGVWTDTGFPMIGVPAVIEGAVNKIDVFFRDPDNQLKHVYWDGRRWWDIHGKQGQIITDPVSCSWGPNRFDVVAVDSWYKVNHWWWDGNANPP
jgi:hypothetical protein